MKAILSLMVALVSSSAFADVICTINQLRSSSGVNIGNIVGIAMVDLSKTSSEFNSFVVKKDGSLLKNVRYSDMVYSKPSEKLGDVDGAVFIALSRDQGRKEGITVSMGTLKNDQELASFEVEARSPIDNITVSYLAKDVEIHCQVPSK